MKKMLLLAIVLAMTTSYSFANPPPKVKECNQNAGHRKGVQRQEFIRHCLAGKPAAVHQKKVKECNIEADKRGLYGELRQKFVYDCVTP